MTPAPSVLGSNQGHALGLLTYSAAPVDSVLGLEQAGFSIVAAADEDALAVESHAHNIERSRRGLET